MTAGGVAQVGGHLTLTHAISPPHPVPILRTKSVAPLAHETQNLVLFVRLQPHALVVY